MKVKVEKLSPNAQLPAKATEGSVCYDVSSVKRVLLSPMEKTVIPTGLAFELPEEAGLEVRPRSGLASKGFIILNSPATLDNDYRGELLILCMNLSNRNILINKGDRIAQIRLFETINIEWEELEELGKTERGNKGLGSTGR